MSYTLNIPSAPHTKAVLQQRQQSTDADNTFFPTLPPSITSLLPNPLSIQTGLTNILTATITPVQPSNTIITSSSDAPSIASVPSSFTVLAGQTTGTLTVTGNSVGTAHVLATLNNSISVNVNVSSPPSGTWPNSPAGTLLIDTPLANLNGLFDVFGSTILTTDSTGPVSPPSVTQAKIDAFATFGGNQLEYNDASTWRELYVGLIIRTNPQFQGRIVGNKMFFIRGPVGTNGVFLFNNGSLVNGSGQLGWVFNSSGIDNSQVLPGGSDPGFFFFGNVGDGTMHVGNWYKIEAHIRASTTRTSQDGFVRFWVNGNAVGSYNNVNYCGPNGETLGTWVQSQTWDGSGDLGTSNTVEWDWYMDHLRIVGVP